MTDPLKNFRLVPPQRDDNDPLFNKGESFSLFDRPGLTMTGLVWVLVPYFFIFWKRQQFFLKEFCALVGFWSADLTWLCWCAMQIEPWRSRIVVLAVLVFHFHFVGFTGALYLCDPSIRFRRVVRWQTITVLMLSLVGPFLWVFGKGAH
jgi:hypothetical protein